MPKLWRKALETQCGAAGKSYLQAGQVNAPYTSAILQNYFDWKCPGTLAWYFRSPESGHTRKAVLRKRQKFHSSGIELPEWESTCDEKRPKPNPYSKQVTLARQGRLAHSVI